jgi:hypothetical protein
MEPEMIEKTFEVTAPARLTLSNIRGSVVVRPSEAGEDQPAAIHIQASKRVGSGDLDRTEVVIFQEADGSVTARTEFQKTNWLDFLFGSVRPCKVDYLVSVPQRCSLQVKCVSSSAQVESLEGEFSLKTVSGDLDLHGLSGPMRVHSVSGEIHGDGLSGRLDLDTVSGSARLLESRFPEAHADSVSGRLEFQTPLGPGPYRFKTISGDVRLSTPAETGCELVFHTLSGRFHTNLPVTRQNLVSGSRQVEIQGGGPHLEAKTTSGDLTILASSLSERPAAVAEKTAYADEHQVLERVAAGELSADEAVQALKVLPRRV